MNRINALIVLGLIFGLSLQAADRFGLSTQQLFKELKSLPQEIGYPRGRYYDMHGNADRRLQELMILRFSVTEEVCAEIDAASPKSHPAFVASLYHVLAMTKDPASIPWLEGLLKGPRAKEVYEYWLPWWHAYLRGADPTQLKWLSEPEKWSAFFRQWASSEKIQTNRLTVLRVIQGWLHDADTQEFFAKVEDNEEASREELMLAQLYLRQHGKPFNEKKLARAITEIRGVNGGQKILLKYAGAIRHELFVPLLIELADDKTVGKFMSAQRSLEAITFQRDISGQASWTKWYEAYGKEGRSRWMDRASSQPRELAATNVSAAQSVLKKAVYTWDDPSMLPHMEGFAAFKELHSEIAGWINLTYHEMPFLRNRLRALAVRIREESAGNLADWAKRLMQTWDFFEEDATSWENFVRMSNMRV